MVMMEDFNHPGVLPIITLLLVLPEGEKRLGESGGVSFCMGWRGKQR
jgi:hypothetical protein